MRKKSILFFTVAQIFMVQGRFFRSWFRIRLKGYPCHVVLPENGPPDSVLHNCGAKITIFDMGVFRRRYAKFTGVLDRLWSVVTSCSALIPIVRKEKIDVISSNTSAIFAGAIVTTLSRRPDIWHVHEIFVTPKWFARVMAIIELRISKGTANRRLQDNRLACIHAQSRFWELRSLRVILWSRLWRCDWLAETVLERAKSARFQMCSAGLSLGAYAGGNSECSRGSLLRNAWMAR